jgi:hypothetical protein
MRQKAAEIKSKNVLKSGRSSLACRELITSGSFGFEWVDHGLPGRVEEANGRHLTTG